MNGCGCSGAQVLAVRVLSALALSGSWGFAVAAGNANGRRIAWNAGGFCKRRDAIEVDPTASGKPVEAGVKTGSPVRCTLRGARPHGALLTGWLAGSAEDAGPVVTERDLRGSRQVA